MSTSEKILKDRRKHSDKIIGQLRKQVRSMAEVKKTPDLCIYATGSFARGDASPHSDLDVFFIDHGEKCSKIQMTLISADLIRACRKLQLPEFSGDGRFLSLHRLVHVREKLGSPDDDYENYFTARMLLLLESTPISDQMTYDKILKQIVDSYYRDYHDHEVGFRPIFLANDIIRFWKTMCLNYEHKRNRKPPDIDTKRRSHLKNLKLKFSRLTMCFSMILVLAENDKKLGPDRVMKIVKKPPIKRIEEVVANMSGGRDVYDRLLEEYGWFLEKTGVAEAQCLEWIGDEVQRNDAFKHARQFGKIMFDLLLKVAQDGDTLRYLII